MRGYIKKVICGVLAAASIAGFVTACGKESNGRRQSRRRNNNTAATTAEESNAFTVNIAGKVGNHIIYSDNIYSPGNYTDKEKKDMMDYLEAVDKKLTSDIYVTGCNWVEMENTWRFYARQVIDGVVVPEVFYATDYDDPEPNIVIASRSRPCDKQLDKTGIMDPEELFDIVYERAEDHSDLLNDYHSKGIYGQYLLCYDEEKDVIYYAFTINDFSYINFDAKTGEIIEEYYWDGTIDD